MSTKTAVKIRTTTVRAFDPETNQVVEHKTADTLNTTEAKALAKSNGHTFIDKRHELVKGQVENATLINLIQE